MVSAVMRHWVVVLRNIKTEVDIWMGQISAVFAGMSVKITSTFFQIFIAPVYGGPRLTSVPDLLVTSKALNVGTLKSLLFDLQHRRAQPTAMLTDPIQKLAEVEGIKLIEGIPAMLGRELAGVYAECGRIHGRGMYLAMVARFKAFLQQNSPFDRIRMEFFAGLQEMIVETCEKMLAMAENRVNDVSGIYSFVLGKAPAEGIMISPELIEHAKWTVQQALIVIENELNGVDSATMPGYRTTDDDSFD